MPTLGPASTNHPPRILVKICGITTVADALAASSAGANAIGLNFHPPSPRFVADDRAAEIVRALPDGVISVGVFVDRPAAEILKMARRVGLHAVQLHGDEPPEDLVFIGRSLPVIRAFRLKDRESIRRLGNYLRAVEDLGGSPLGVLVDAYVPGLAGGTGMAVDPGLLAALPPLSRLILAGGLTPENVAERAMEVRPWMVDVAGGVESAPGVKDPAKMRAFIQAVYAVESGGNRLQNES